MKTAAALLASLLFTACAARAEPAKPPPKDAKVAVFAGGCFWCMESDFEHLDGVYAAISGYAGGPEKNPTYHQVGYGKTGHAESVQVFYDAKKISYAQLVDYFFKHIDPTQVDGQFCDRGHQYRTVVFYGNDDEKRIALLAKEQAALQLKAKIATEVVPSAEFWVAEDYHQDYAKKEPLHYQGYRMGCGRDARVKQLWK